MKIKIIQIGKTKDDHFAKAEEEFLKRLKNHAKMEILTLKEENKGEINKIKELEGKKILEHFNKDSFNMALDQYGQQLNSKEFAELLLKQRDFGKGQVTFIIGGPYGISDEVLKNVDYKLSFSKMTFTHIMIRSFLLEQIYRAFTIVNGKSYHY